MKIFYLSVPEYSYADSTYQSDGYTVHDKDMIKDGRWYRFYIRNDRGGTSSAEAPSKASAEVGSSAKADSVRFVFDIREIAKGEVLARR